MQLTAAVHLVVLVVNDVFIRFTIMKLKYILTTLLVEYSILRINMIFMTSHLKCSI